MTRVARPGIFQFGRHRSGTSAVTRLLGLAGGDLPHEPASTFSHEALALAPHPWLVVEDSGHMLKSTSAVLGYFDHCTQVGDRIVVEDGVVVDLEGEHCRLYDDGPNRAVAEFLVKAPSRYDIDVETCDFYGPNVTYSPNGWLIRRAPNASECH